MNLTVTVRARQAQQAIQQIRTAVQGMDAQVRKSNATPGLGQQHIDMLQKFGNRLQWTGRMIEYNFTLPIAAAIGISAKWALANEKAMVHIQKVYGDTAAAAAQYQKQSNGTMTAQEAQAKAVRVFSNELNALDGAFTQLSNAYGVQKSQVLDIAGAWAAAGVSGKALAESVQNTLKTMILGDIDADKATSSLIAIQSQYNLSTKQLMQTINVMNAVENQTGVSMGGLIDGFTRAAGVARVSGVDVRHLAADIAALSPAAGTAANAGNALKTIFSRLIKPTKETNDVLQHIGVNTESLAWQSSNTQERLLTMAKAFDGLGSSAKGVVAATVASTWQVNKFAVLMDELNKTNGYYQKALDATTSSTKTYKIAQQELNAVLTSNPQRLKQMWVILQNAMSDIVQPLIPMIVYLAQELAKLATAFSNLNPATQKLILFLAVALAAVGPLARYTGALITLYTVFARIVGVATGALGLFFKASMLILTPFRLIGTLLTTVIGGFAAMMSGIVGAVTGGSLMVVRIWGTWLAGMLAAVRGWSAVVLAQVAIFRTKFLVSWTMTSLLTTGIWSRMWLMLELAATKGWALLIAINSRFAATLRIFAVIGAAWVTAFRQTWAALRVMAMAGWASLTAISAAASVAQVGIFTRMRQMITVIWLTMAGGLATIWRGMAATSLVAGRAVAGGFLVGMVNLVKSIGPLLLRFGRLLTGPIGIAITVAITLFTAFHDQILQIFSNLGNAIAGKVGSWSKIWDSIVKGIQNAFYSLPQSVQNAMQAVINIVSAAAKAVYNWFSYINPWAHHSPSLVENVSTGMSRVMTEFERIKGVGPLMKSAYSQMSKFGKMTSRLGLNSDQQKRQSDIKTLRQAGGKPAVQAYKGLSATEDQLKGKLNEVNAVMTKQQAIVDKWTAKEKTASDALDAQQKKLDALQKTLDGYNDKLSTAQNALSDYSSAPLQGEQAMNDLIEANTVAQNKYNLKLMDMQRASGTLDQIQSKLEAINGAQEVLSGQRSDLRAAGAGSEILSNLDDQMKGLDKQKNLYEQQAGALQDVQDKLDQLSSQADRLNLVKAIKFDDLNYQIQKAADTTKELSFDDIMAGIKQSRDQMTLYSGKVDAATKAVNKQQAAVDKATAAHDKVQAKLDKENDSLDRMKDTYDKINDAISAIDTSLGDTVSAASAKLQDAKNAADKASKAGAGGKKGAKPPKGPKPSPALQDLINAGGAGFPDVGGKQGISPRTNWKDQSKQIDKWTQDLAKQTAGMFDNINPFKGLWDKAKQFWNSFKDKATEVLHGVGDVFAHMFDNVDFTSGKSGQFLSAIGKVGKWITDNLKLAGKGVKALVDLLGGDLVNVFVQSFRGIVQFIQPVIKELSKWGPTIQAVWAVIKPTLAIIMAAFAGLLKVFLNIYNTAIAPLMHNIGRAMASIIQIIRGAFEIVFGIINAVVDTIAAIFTGDWGKAAKAWGMVWQGIKDVVAGTFKAIWYIIKGAAQLIWNVVEGIVKGVVGFFKWLWDELVGHSIVPDIIDAIVRLWKGLTYIPRWIWNNILKPIVNFFHDLYDDVVSLSSSIWDGVKSAWNGLKNAGQWVWDNVLKPVVDFFKSMWNDHIKPFLKAEVQGWKNIWGGMKKMGKWVWDHILKPVLDKFRELWNKYIKPFLKAEVQGWKDIWAGMKKMGKWVWDHILKPVWDWFHDLWSKYVKPSLSAWWKNITNVWNKLKSLPGWVWNNVLKPVWNKVKDLWGDVKKELGKWWGNITSIWNHLKDLGGWIKNNVMDPVVDKFKNGWTSIRNWFSSKKDWILSPMHSIVKGLVAAVNFIIHGINKLDALPGISIHISDVSLPRGFAAGTDELPIVKRRVAAGFKTNGARAIVGEGKPNYPEYVIPTDPTHRRRATALLGSAATRLGVGLQGAAGDSAKDIQRVLKENPMATANGYAQFGIGGILGDIGGAIAKGAKWTGSNLKNAGVHAVKGVYHTTVYVGGKAVDVAFKSVKTAIKAIMSPFVSAARGLADKTSWGLPMHGNLVSGMLGPIGNWIGLMSDSYGKNVKDDTTGINSKSIKGALKFAKNQVGKPYVWGGVGPGGYDCSGFMSAITNVLRGKSPYSRVGATASFPWPGFSSYNGQSLKSSFVIGSTKSYAGGVGHMAGTLGGVNVESRGGHGPIVGSAARGYLDSGFNTHAGIYHLRDGAIARARRGGTVVRVAEGGQDEAITPLPRNWKTGGDGGDKVYNFYGDLSFPNITDPNDAKTFLDNLDNLAG